MFAFLVFAILAAIIVSLLIGSMPAIKAFGFGFLFSSEWNPVTEKFGALVPIVGTLVTSIIALLIGIPVSFGIALFLTEMSPPLAAPPARHRDRTAGRHPQHHLRHVGPVRVRPAVCRTRPTLAQRAFSATCRLIGLLFEGPPMGIGMLTAGIILAIMVIPFIAAVMRDVFEIVPPMLKESAYGLGATTWEVVWNVVLPYTKIGVVGGIMLGLGRALGETMAVTFVIGNAHQLHASLFMPGNSIASALANEFTEAVGELYTSALIELGLILFFITFVVLACAKILLIQLKKREGKAT